MPTWGVEPLCPSRDVGRGCLTGDMSERRDVIVYIDGFALYKGLLQRTFPQYKWLDVVALSDRLFHQYQVKQVRYFTARLKPLPHDPQMPQRQDAYLRALETLPRLSIHYGRYILSKQWLPIHPQEIVEGRVKTVRVKRPEEKGTDVSLASHLMLDAFRDRSDLYAVVTNDSDLVTPLQLLATEARRNVGLVSVAGSRYNKAFDDVPLYTVRKIRRGTLQESQLSDRVQDAEGRWVHKPTSWI